MLSGSFQAPGKQVPAVRRISLIFCYVLALAGPFARESRAGLSGAFQNFTLTNSAFANGEAATFNGGLSLLFSGPNDGSGEPGTTDLTAVVMSGGLFQFDYIYTSLDAPGF